MKCFTLLSILITSLITTATAQTCTYSDATRIANLPTDYLSEASGISASPAYPERLYHVNDSSNGNRFFVSDFAVTSVREVTLGNITVQTDVEDMDVGKCGDGTCLFFADIGDNTSVRPQVKVYVVPEQASYANEVRYEQRIRLQYPDGAHDAEGFAVHANGDFFIVTKASVLSAGALQSRVYRVAYDDWRAAKDERVLMTHVATIDFSDLGVSVLNPLAKLATGLDIRDDGKQWLLLTYAQVYVFNFDLAEVWTQADFDRLLSFEVLKVKRLPQQESISYVSNSNDFVYGTEARLKESALMYVRCETN